MPLIDLDRPLYIRRDRFYVDNQDRTVNSKDPFDIEIDLDKRYENVQSIEITDYNIPQDISPSFIAPTTTTNGNNIIDVRMTYTLGPQTLEFTVVMDATIKYDTFTDLLTAIETALNTEMDAQGDPLFNTGNIQWDVEPAVNATYGVATPRFDLVGALNSQIYGFFLFGTGPNRGNAPERLLGYDEGVDTIVIDQFPPPYQTITPTYGPRAYHAAYQQPFRFVDVIIDESEESFRREVPTARIQLSDASYITRRVTAARPRLYTNPLHYTDKLHLRLRLEDERVPTTLSTQGWDVALDILQLSNEPTIPNWVQQKLIYI